MDLQYNANLHIIIEKYVFYTRFQIYVYYSYGYNEIVVLAIFDVIYHPEQRFVKRKTC